MDNNVAKFNIQRKMQEFAYPPPCGVSWSLVAGEWSHTPYQWVDLTKCFLGLKVMQLLIRNLLAMFLRSAVDQLSIVAVEVLPDITACFIICVVLLFKGIL